jgi:hypothetical protein
MILRNLLYFIAILLFIGWVLGYFAWPHKGNVIHILIVLAVISLILGMTRKVSKD